MASITTSRIVYTVSKDIHDLLFLSYNVPETNASALSSSICQSILGNPVKFRKPIIHKIKKVDKPAVLEREEVQWKISKANPGFAYTKDVNLQGGYYPVCNMSTQKCVFAKNGGETRELTNSDKRTLSSAGLDF
jgi:hypothetical protein